MTNIDLSALRKVISHKWRIQSYSQNKASASVVAYIDARDVMDLLDSVLGPENWQDEYTIVGGALCAGIGIKIGDAWVWKHDVGTKTDIEADKGEFSDAFKRAAVKWGVGRFLYDLDVKYVKTNEPLVKVNGKATNYPYPVDASGKRVYDINQLING